MADDDVAPAMPSPGFLAALTTEHFVVQSARGVISSEATSRATIYLGTLSSTLIAVGFLADQRPALVAFLAAALPVLVSLGALTFLRLVQIGVEDVAHLAAMQLIRRRYARSGRPRLLPRPRRRQPDTGRVGWWGERCPRVHGAGLWPRAGPLHRVHAHAYDRQRTTHPAESS